MNKTMELLPESPRALARLLASVTIITILLAPGHAYPEEKVITAEASYLMGDGETPSFAEAMVLRKAKQQALEQAGTYLQSYTKIQNMELTADQITTIAGGVLQTEVLKQERSLVGTGVRFDITIKAVVTTDRMEELAKKLRGEDIMQEYKILQEQYAGLMQELDSLKIALAQSRSGPERDAALEKIRDREKNFRSLQKSESALYEKLISGEALLAKALSQISKKESEKAIVDELFARILDGGIRVILGEPQIQASLKDRGFVLMSIPVTLQAAPSLKTALIETARRFDGDVLEGKIDRDGKNGSAVRLGSDPEILTHLKMRLYDLRLLIEARAGSTNAIVCSPRNKIEILGTGSVVSYLFGWWFNSFGSSPPYGFFVQESPQSFRVKIRLPTELVERATSLTGKVSEIHLGRVETCERIKFE